MVNPISLNSPVRFRALSETDNDSTRTAGAGAASGPVAAPRPTASGDTVSLSPQAARLPDGMRGPAPVDKALVERIGAAIAEGRYPVDPDAVARAMLRELADFVEL